MRRSHDAAYFTDSQVQRLYKVPIVTERRASRSPEHTAGVNANGIAASLDGKMLFIVKSNDDLPFTADSTTGVTREVALD